MRLLTVPSDSPYHWANSDVASEGAAQSGEDRNVNDVPRVEARWSWVWTRT